MNSKSVHVIRLGTIKGEILRQSTRLGDRYSLNLVRLYKNGDRWQESRSFGRDDLPLVAKVADMAHTWMFLQRHLDAGMSTEESQDG